MPKSEKSLWRARRLRSQQTVAEGLLWSKLRARQLCGLKFRRQFPIGPFIADFACIEHQLIIEIDGKYHDYQEQEDLSRQEFLESDGWKVMRFSNETVLHDAETVLREVARVLRLAFQYQKRSGNVSGSQKKFRGL